MDAAPCDGANAADWRASAKIEVVLMILRKDSIMSAEDDDSLPLYRRVS